MVICFEQLFRFQWITPPIQDQGARYPIQASRSTSCKPFPAILIMKALIFRFGVVATAFLKGAGPKSSTPLQKKPCAWPKRKPKAF
jgi:hypothetical protein